MVDVTEIRQVRKSQMKSERYFKVKLMMPESFLLGEVCKVREASKVQRGQRGQGG